jgi:hypothetical protein
MGLVFQPHSRRHNAPIRQGSQYQFLAKALTLTHDLAV